LPEAFAAAIELPDDSMWDRLVRDTAPGSLLGALTGGLGPSHRSSVALLSQMPRSQRGTVLRQLGALQLMAKLIPKAKAQVTFLLCLYFAKLILSVKYVLNENKNLFLKTFA
jgi:hypothetical protein